jgi:hypothetical protein
MSVASAAGFAAWIGSEVADMTDDARPLPQYGEYATPEQQAKAMGLDYVPPAVTPVLPAPVPAQVAVAPRGGYANRFLTIILMCIGGVILIDNVPEYFSYASTLSQGFAALGVTAIHVPASFNRIGILALVANAVIYIGTVLLSVRALRRGRISFYIPILGFVVFALVLAILIAIVAPGYFSQFATN